MASAYLLVSHGSHDPRPEVAMQQLAKLLSESLPKHENLIGTATLEVNPQPLYIQIKEFADQAVARGCDRLLILPLFLLSGVHVVTDIPAQVAQAQQAIGEKISIEIKPHIGSHPHLSRFLTQIIARMEAEATILLAHHSRRLEAQQQTATLAANVGAIAAYWGQAPDLKMRVRELVTLGYQQIAILAYFLFPGSITDAIAQAVEELKLQFPDITLQLAPPLGASVELAALMEELIKREEKIFG
ncbi:MAG TPA: sirohydrochlorin chelatase [Nostocaceae cyanobacterium]|nr:sirohydrochlorin chelatase [Nostocaceae cyanobacterium]